MLAADEEHVRVIVLVPGREFVLRPLLRVQDGTAGPVVVFGDEITENDEAEQGLPLLLAGALVADGRFVVGQDLGDLAGVAVALAVDFDDGLPLAGLVVDGVPAAGRRGGRLGYGSGSEE